MGKGGYDNQLKLPSFTPPNPDEGEAEVYVRKEI